MANVIVYNYVSRDAQVHLEEFRSEFQAAFMMDTTEQWARETGLTIQTTNLKVTLPIPLSAAGYVERKGDIIYRRLAERSFSFTPRVWQDGFAEFAEIIEAPDFLGFAVEPANMAAAAAQLPNELVSAAIEANPTQASFDNVTFFNTAHPYNLLDTATGTYSNDITGAGTDLTAANIGIARQNFRKINGPNGKPLGVRFKGIIIPPALEEQAARLAQQDTIIQVLGSGFGSVDNVRTKGLKYWVSDQLTNDIKWYPVGEKIGMYPYVTTDRGAPEMLILGKGNSALYETQGKVGAQSKLQVDSALAFPQLMQRWAGTGP